MPDINFPFVFFQLLNILILIAWVALAFRALRRLSETPLSEGLRFGWALLILLVPVLGAVAFLNSRPKASA